MDRLGLPISWLPILFWDTKGLVPIRTGVVALWGITTVFLSHGVVLPMYLKRAALRATPVKFSLATTIRTACKVTPLAATLYTVVWLDSGVTTGMFFGMSQLINILCGEFPFLVSVSVTFLSVTCVSTYQWIAFWITFGVILFPDSSLRH